jgi:hypothetical protein
MNRKMLRLIAIFFALPLCFLHTHGAFAQETFEQATAKNLDSLLNAGVDSTVNQIPALGPDDAMQGIMAPSGWGGSGTYMFGGIGGTYPELYARKARADLIASGGVCFGDAQKAVNVALGLNMTDVHRFRNFSENLIVSHEFSPASSISAGGLQLFADKGQTDSPGATFFLAFSHAVQWAPSTTGGNSALSYTIGIGNGRFLDKSPDDVKRGKGKYATAVFGIVSYEVITHVNLNAEWYGQNLGLSVGVRPFENPLSIGLGVDNLTRYTGDRTSMILTIGYPLSLMRGQN